MEPRTLQFMIDACQGKVLHGDPNASIHRVCTDSRQVQPGDLFVALRGDRFDGHGFLSEAAVRGSTAVLVDEARLLADNPPCAIIAVPDTRTAYGRIAARYRSDFVLPVIAVAGSNGKTTTKEMLATLLRRRFRTLSSLGSFNNDIGVPATLLDLACDHDFAVLEFGTNHPGELAALLRLAKPRFGVLTSIGREHLEFFQDLEGVLREEGVLAEMLPEDGKLFLNGDTPGTTEIFQRASASVVSAGFGPDNPWRAHTVRMTEVGASFEVEAPLSDFRRTFHLQTFGRHQVVNALLAMAAAAEFGLTAAEVQAGLRLFRPVKGRLQLSKMGRVTVLDDSYNANADSVRAALDVLSELPCLGRRLAVLGDMAETGAHGQALHAEVGRYAAAAGIDQLLAVGRMAAVTAGAARQAGLVDVREAGDVGEAAQVLRELLQAGDLILLKGSRVSGLEQIKDQLQVASHPESIHDAGQGRGAGV